QSLSSFDKLREKYMAYEENDIIAFKYLQPFIEKAKKEKNYAQLSRGYIDATNFFSGNKLVYADSAISAAKMSKKNDFIARAYLNKGSLFYFNHKQYQNALNEYLKAHTHAEHIEDIYLRNRIEYHLAIVKGYLGYYEEALALLNNCIQYFENEFK